VSGRAELTAFPIDLVHVRLDDEREIIAVAHVLARGPDWRGGWWRGDVLAVMNAEYIGRFDVAPRGHPNDGRVEVLAAGGDLGLRQRFEVRRRLPSGSHLPHPSIRVRPVRAETFEFGRPLRVRVDGVESGSARRIEIRVDPDAATVHA